MWPVAVIALFLAGCGGAALMSREPEEQGEPGEGEAHADHSLPPTPWWMKSDKIDLFKTQCRRFLSVDAASDLLTPEALDVAVSEKCDKKGGLKNADVVGMTGTHLEECTTQDGEAGFFLYMGIIKGGIHCR